MFIFNSYGNGDTENNYVSYLQRQGDIPSDFEKKSIQFVGEAPGGAIGKNSGYFNHLCPEVSLFDSDNSLNCTKGRACSSGSYDIERKPVLEIWESRHFSDCAEFSMYHYEKRKRSKRTTRTGISQKLRFEIFQRDKFTCQYCGRTKDGDKVKLELDHIVPVSKGGTDEINNLTTSCRDCNQGKSNKII